MNSSHNHQHSSTPSGNCYSTKQKSALDKGRMKRKKRKDFQHKGRFWVYIVECSDGTYYTGCTNDIETRIKEHNRSSRGAKYLKGKLPVKLAYVKEYSHYKRAAGRERSIKRLSHKQKEELIRIYGQMTAKGANYEKSLCSHLRLADGCVIVRLWRRRRRLWLGRSSRNVRPKAIHNKMP